MMPDSGWSQALHLTFSFWAGWSWFLWKFSCKDTPRRDGRIGSVGFIIFQTNKYLYKPRVSSTQTKLRNIPMRIMNKHETCEQTQTKLMNKPMSIINKNETSEQRQPCLGQRDDIGKTMEYIAQRCQDAFHVIVWLISLVHRWSKFYAQLQINVVMLCRQRWNVHGAHSDGLQNCNFVNSKLVVG